MVLSKFSYHRYYKKGSKELQTAITPNSAITKILKALGWEFSGDGVEIDELIGNWVELNVNDWEIDSHDLKYTASTIDNVGPYKGPTPKDSPDAKPKAEKVPEKEEAKVEEPKKDSKEMDETDKKIAELEDMHEKGHLTADGLKLAKESLEAARKE